MAAVRDYTAIVGVSSAGGAPTFNGGLVGTGAVVTYSFETSAVLDDAANLPLAFLQSFRPFSDQQTALARQALSMWASVSGLVLVEVPGNLGEMRFGNYDFNLDAEYAGSWGFSHNPNKVVNPDLSYPSAYEHPLGSDVFVNIYYTSAPLLLYLHEIGHALGLKHTFQGDLTLAPDIDNNATSVMSYTGEPGSVTGLGIIDGDAVRYLYGAPSVDPTNFSYDPSTLTFTWFETAGADVQRGTPLSDVMDGLGGSDQLYGYGGNDVLIGGAGDDTIVGGSGNDWVRPGAGNDSVEGRSSSNDAVASEINTVDYGDAIGSVTLNLSTIAYDSGAARWYFARGSDIGFDVLRGFSNVVTGTGSDSVTGDASANVLTTGAGDDTILAGEGNDVIAPGPGDDAVDGGAGFDVLLLTGVRRDHTISGAWAGLSSSSSADGSDSIAEVENVHFLDGALWYDTASVPAQVYRLYDTALGRAPDLSGLDNWSEARESGTSLLSVVTGFTNSAEFQQRYGAPDNASFVELLYNNALNRASDAAGKQSWLSFLDSGHSRAEVVIGFSESQEHIDSTAAAVRGGLWLEDDMTSAIARLYDTTFGRLPDESGLTNWRNFSEAGHGLAEIAPSFTGSAEFQSTYGALANGSFVEQLYRNSLHRAGDAQGVANWTAFLDAGHSRAEVLIGFSESQEHINNTAAHIDGGVWVL